MAMSMKMPHLIVCFVPNQSDSASPPAVVESLITQNSAVTSGTLAAMGSVFNHAGCRRMLVELLLGIVGGRGSGFGGRTKAGSGSDARREEIVTGRSGCAR